MPNINDISIREIRTLEVPPIPDYLMRQSSALPLSAPVTVQIGTPIVDIPGCVESHPDAGKNKSLMEDDPDGVQTYCDGQVPSFNPIDYSPEDMTIQRSTPPPKTETPETPDIEPPVIPPIQSQTIKCQDGEKLNEELNICEKIVVEVPAEEPTWVEQYLPSAGEVATTATIALTAATAALVAKPIADLILKLVKPAVKKIVKKVNSLRGKEEEILSVQERRQIQREQVAVLQSVRKALGKK